MEKQPQINQNKQMYQTKPTKLSFPNKTYHTKPAKMAKLQHQNQIHEQN